MTNLNNIDNISYQGIVTIKKVDTKFNIIKDSFRIKNNGTKHLFKYLCDCLIQNYNPSNSPRYLDASAEKLTLSDNDIKDFTSNVTNRSLLSNIEVKESYNNYNVIFSGIILYDQLRDKTAGLKSVVLFPNKNIQDISKPLAFINIVPEEAEDGITISASEVLIIEWELQFKNAS